MHRAKLPGGEVYPGPMPVCLPDECRSIAEGQLIGQKQRDRSLECPNGRRLSEGFPGE